MRSLAVSDKYTFVASAVDDDSSWAVERGARASAISKGLTPATSQSAHYTRGGDLPDEVVLLITYVFTMCEYGGWGRGDTYLRLYDGAGHNVASI